MLKYFLVALVLVVNITYASVLVTDLVRNRKIIREEPGNPWLIGAAAPVVLFFATMGIPDMIMDTLLFRKLKLVDDKRLPGTLITVPAIPLGVVALVYLLSAEIDIKIVLVCMICQSVGSSLGVRMVAKLDGARVKKVVAYAMLLSAAFLLLRFCGVGGDGGSYTTLPTHKLVICGICALLLGFGNMMGVGAKAPYMSLLLLLGLQPDCVLPVIMPSCTVAGALGGMQYIRRGMCQRKLALIYSTVGFIGIAAGFLFVANLPQTALQIILMAVTVYTGVSMLRKK